MLAEVIQSGWVFIVFTGGFSRMKDFMGPYIERIVVYDGVIPYSA